MFELQQETTRAINGKPTPVKIYKNSQTGSMLSTYRLYVDRTSNEWWTFEDLFTLPFIRQMAAKRVIDLYGNGLSLGDIKKMAADIKALAKSNDVEKYEKIYAKAMEMDMLADTMADPVKQCIGLSTVYLLYKDERPDAYDQHVMNDKMNYLALDITAQAFFLNWWTDCMQHSGKVLKGLSLIASTVQK